MTPPTPDAALSQTWSGTVVAAATTAFASGSFTPLGGSILIVDASSATAKLVPNAISGGGLTWTQRCNITTNSPLVRWTAPVPAGGVGAMTVSVTWHSTETTSSRLGCAAVGVWPSSQIVGTPHNLAAFVTSAPYQDTITSVTTSAAGGSVLACAFSDFNGVATAPTYSPAATTLERFNTSTTATINTFYQTASSPTAQTYGMSAPSGMQIMLGAIELVQVIPDPVSTSLMLNQAVTRSNFY